MFIHPPCLCASARTDTGSSCAGGIVRPEVRILADRYRSESIKYRDLESQALAPAEQFAALKELAEEQINLIKAQQSEVQRELDELNEALATVEGDVQTYQEQVYHNQLRPGALQELRGVTVQTLLQLLQVEKLNLA